MATRWYPGVARSVYRYAPHGADEGDSIKLLVSQDGPAYVGPLVQATTVPDNLVRNAEIPMTVGLFVGAGENGPSYPFFDGDDD